MDRFHDLGIPLLVGHSRKYFLEAVTDKPSAERDAETLVVSEGLASKGIEILRVHGRERTRHAIASATLENGGPACGPRRRAVLTMGRSMNEIRIDE